MKNLMFWMFLMLMGLSINVTQAQALRIVVSILPQKHFVEQVGGEQVEVAVMVQPGHSPATYALTLKQMSQLKQAHAYIRMGVPFEEVWISRLQKNNPDLPMFDARTGIHLQTLEKHEHEHDEAHDHHPQDNLDPHIWLNPLHVITMVKQIQTLLSDLDPQHAALYAQNAEAFIQQLEQLDGDIRSQLSSVQGQRFLVFHPSWGYFARAYGLQQIAIEQEGKSPGAKSLQHLIQQAKELNIKVVFVQPQFNQRNAKTIAQAIDGEVVAIDPLAERYIENLRTVAPVFVRSVR